MLIISDIHANFDALQRVAATGEPLLILGDLINFIDYRTGKGIAEDIYGSEHTRQLIINRRTANWEASRKLWREATAGREEEVRELITAAVEAFRPRSAHAAKCHTTTWQTNWADSGRSTSCAPMSLRRSSLCTAT